MNSALWISQVLLALTFGYSGIMKSTQSTQRLVAIGQTGVEHLSTPLIRFIGISELLGTVGLLLPWYTQFLPILTPITALCLSAIMIPASVIHYNRHELKAVGFNIFIFLTCLVVAYGRFEVLS
jgi:uncharacterized membrane protein YphA (DoxX/SURF4 family)